MLFLSLILKLSIILKTLLWAICIFFKMYDLLSSSLSLTWEHSWRPYLNLDIHRLSTSFFMFSTGIWFFNLLISKSFLLRAKIRRFFPEEWLFHFWSSSIVIPNNFDDLSLFSMILVPLPGWLKYLVPLILNAFHTPGSNLWSWD